MKFLKKLFGGGAKAPQSAVLPVSQPAIPMPIEAPVVVVPQMPAEESHSIQRRVAWMRAYNMSFALLDAPMKAEEPLLTFAYDLWQNADRRVLGRIIVTVEGFAVYLHAEGQYVFFDHSPTLEQAANEILTVYGVPTRYVG